MKSSSVIENENIISLLNPFLKASQNAAIATYPWIGRGDKIEADNAATKVLRDTLNKIDMNAHIVIGEGEMDEAPMLYIGESLGTGIGPHVDIAVDPVEGTTLVSKGQRDSLVVMAVAKRGNLLHAPDMYMEKIAVGPKAKGSINLNLSLKENMIAVAKALDKEVCELTVMIQDRPRHAHLISQVFELEAKVHLFSDVDITGAIGTAIEDIDVDILVGTGGAPEGVIAAVALRCLGGDFQGRLLPENEHERSRCIEMGLVNPTAVLKMEDIVKTNECFFVATGITTGTLLSGVQRESDGRMYTQSFVTTEIHSQFIHTKQ